MNYNKFKKEKSHWDLYVLDIKKYLIKEYNLDKISDKKLIKDVINNLDFFNFNSKFYNLEDDYVIDILVSIENSVGCVLLGLNRINNYKTFKVISFYRWQKIKNRDEKLKLLLDK